MDHVLASDTFTSAQILLINYCRLFLTAVTISDLATATGTHLMTGVPTGRPSAWSSTPRWLHTNQARPSPAAWKLWVLALALFSAPSGKLRQPLTQWITPPSCQRQTWPVYYDPTNDTLLFLKQTVYERHPRHQDVYTYDYAGFTTHLDETSYPVDVLDTDHGWTIIQHSSYVPRGPRLPPDSFQAYCHLLDEWEAQLLRSITLHYPPFELAHLLTTQEFRACSDGSAVPLSGTYGWSSVSSMENV